MMTCDHPGVRQRETHIPIGGTLESGHLRVLSQGQAMPLPRQDPLTMDSLALEPHCSGQLSPRVTERRLPPSALCTQVRE